MFTPLNIAPELVVGDGKADAKVDVWSMGVVLFQLAGHEYPIKATSVLDLQKLMQQRQITRPKAITDNLLWDLLMKILQFDKKDRPTAEQALQHPYFTGEQASKDISALQRQIVNAALLSQQGGDKSITLYDINPSYAVPGNEIKAAISYDPDVDLQNLEQTNFNTTWKLSDFKKIKKIGRGRFGSVSSYQEIRTQRNVAIKQCEYETEEEKAKFHREIDVMNDIIKIIRQSANQQQFIHVIEPLGFFVDEVEEKAYLVMELCSGG
ncbi:MAG: hypothetical protein EZS28_030344, partial [Streblomastix strix]